MSTALATLDITRLENRTLRQLNTLTERLDNEVLELELLDAQLGSFIKKNPQLHQHEASFLIRLRMHMDDRIKSLKAIIR